MWGILVSVSIPDHKRRRSDGGYVLDQDRTGVG